MMWFASNEEATNFTEFQWSQIKLCCRTSETIKVPFRPRRYYTANPGGCGHAWFRRIFIDREYRDGENPDDFVFIPARIYDNTVVMERNPEYLNELKSLPDDLRRAYLDGDWDTFQGMFFSEWNTKIHVVEPFEIPSWWKRFCSLDYGQDMTACYWYAVSSSGQIYVYRELYQPNLILSEAARKIVEMTPPDEHIGYIAASPDLWNRRQETGASGMEIMSRNGLSNLIKAKNSRIQGWRAVREVLKPYPILDEQNKEVLDEYGEIKKTARLQVFSTCRNLIKCMPLLQYDPHNTEDAASNPHDVTHGPEALRYAIASRYPESSQLEQLYFPKGTTETDKERIRTNMEFSKVYDKMRNNGSMFGGW
jgi:phage terminase large subunit